MRLSFALTFVLGLAIMPALARAQVASPLAEPSPTGRPPEKVKEPTSIKLVLHPAPEPKPALKYLLLPPLLDRRPGNAAVHYGKVKAEQNAFFGDGKLQVKISEWANMPLDKLPKEEARKTLQGSNNPIFRSLQRAARCETCDWDLPIREEEFISILLPEAQESRTFGRLLAAKARLEIAERQYDEAIGTLQSGYALGRNVARGQTLVNGLVGIAICGIMSKTVEDWAQQPGAPNLYWALTNLPRPLVDLRAGFEAEMAMLYLSYPELRDLEHKDYPPQYWDQLLGKMFQRAQAWSSGRMPPEFEQLAVTALALRGYPMAKRALIAWGRSPAEVEAMPVAQVIMLYTIRTYDELRDDSFKWFALPIGDAGPGMGKAEQKLHTALREGREVIPVAGTLLPAVTAVTYAIARNERTIAVLRIIEALRLYGAGHDGRLPDSLADITEVPIPLDPLTGKEFIYTKDGNVAILDAHTPPGTTHARFAWKPYEIRFAAKGK